jgi:23S rRNA pseudouridine1911/1915/1917 synthase
MNIKITAETSNQRLDKYLVKTKLLPALSRGQIQKLIGQGLIKINGQTTNRHYSLKIDDIVSITNTQANAKATNKGSKDQLNCALPIIEEAADFLVINKPAGLAAQAADGYALTDWLKAKYPAIKGVGDDPARPGLVHRLDKDASGLMLIAKNPAAFNHFKKQFQGRTVIKEYTALVHGRIKKPSDKIIFPIKRSRDGYKMAALPAISKGRPAASGRLAETEFRVMASFINYALLKVKIKTGRTHQIRVHLAAYGHPIVGDKIYGTARTRRQNQKLNLKRVFLVADHLGFYDLNNNAKDYKIDLPTELKNVLKVIK